MRNLARPRTLASVVVISLEKSGPGIGDTLCLELTPEFSKPAFCFALGMRGTFTTNIESVFQKKKEGGKYKNILLLPLLYSWKNCISM
jgi:hypothetical protein